ncbi:hypothetical protein LguiA_022665 [Lonicera macranthoides]
MVGFSSSANTLEDVCSLDSTIWRDCSFIQAIDFTLIAGISQNPKYVNTFNELEPPNSIKNNIDGGDGQSSEDTIIAVPLDSYFNGIDCNFDNGESRLDPNDRCEQPYELQPDDDCLFDLPCEQSLSMVGSNPSHTTNNVKEIKIDVTPVFTTDEVFTSRYNLIDWCQSQGRGIRTIVVTLKSDKGNGTRRRPRLLLGCERGGIHRKNKENLNKRECASRKCNCPFKLRGVNIGGDNWKIEVKCGIHNHELPKTLVGHPYAGRLSKEEKIIVVDMSLAGVKPKEILNAIKRRHKENASIMKTIYNVKSNMRTHAMEGRSAMQQLFKVLIEKHYVYWHRSNETTDEILDLFWAHPESILLAKCFPSLVIVDCTYKTN